ncbi:MAG: hypothetical protein AB7K41_15440, partial [Bdellovibrionales bacterium]
CFFGHDRRSNKAAKRSKTNIADVFFALGFKLVGSALLFFATQTLETLALLIGARVVSGLMDTFSLWALQLLFFHGPA